MGELFVVIIFFKYEFPRVENWLNKLWHNSTVGYFAGSLNPSGFRWKMGIISTSWSCEDCMRLYKYLAQWPGQSNTPFCKFVCICMEIVWRYIKVGVGYGSLCRNNFLIFSYYLSICLYFWQNCNILYFYNFTTMIVIEWNQ